ncbi:alpha/beta hydrolase [Mesorhizobium sp. CAU 1741]|uniref:alpha/beta fold hydrolase n=1 Tax=Mesorhizobium sp. CAU 1741 TaxID=3140366 RepID=UPI00325BE191
MADTGTIETRHGVISYMQSRADGPAILLLHGNSSCKEVFERQFEAPGLAGYRIVAIDLPGHGASEDAKDPARSYTFGGYAEMATEAAAKLGLNKPVIFGWSLGGHIALEMIGSGFDAAGVMISGTPPVTPELESLMAGFNIDPAAENLTGKRDFTEEDVVNYASHTSAVDGSVNAHLLSMCRRTDGRARETMFSSVMEGRALDERAIVATSTVPLAIVNGEGDVFIQPGYFDTLNYAALWPKGVVSVKGAGHAPFLQKPEAFNALLAEFAKSADAS